jgi:ketosteroid isomerase-like protein
MKKTLYLLMMVFLLFSFKSNAQNKDESAIRAILAKQSTAWNQGNLDAFMKGYWENDSLMFIGKKGLTYGWQNTLNNYKKNYPDAASMGQLTFTIIEVKQLSAQYEEVIGKWQLARKVGDIEGHFTLLFQKIKGKWYIVMDHSS